MRTTLLLCLMAVGCATPYQRHAWTGGFSDSQLAERVFEIAFAGNGWTHQSTVEAYALRRAAEIAVARGFDGFVEMRDNTSTDQSVSYTEKKSSTGQTYQEANVTTSHTTKKRIYLVTAEQMRELPAAIDARIVLSRWGIVPPAPTATAPVLARPDWDEPAPKVTE